MGDLAATEVGPTDEALSSEDVETGGLLVALCFAAERNYGLRVGECNAPGAPSRWGPVHRVHAPGSLHYSGRAADIAGLEQNMRRFCWVSREYGPRVAELIHNPGVRSRTAAVFRQASGDTRPWEAHRNHVHLAV